MHVAQLAVGGEQRQRAPTDPRRDRRDELLDRRIEHLVFGQGHIGRQADERLLVEIERRWQDHLFDLGTEPDARAEVVERAADREGCRREHGRPPLRVNPLTQQRPDVDGRRA